VVNSNNTACIYAVSIIRWFCYLHGFRSREASAVIIATSKSENHKRSWITDFRKSAFARVTRRTRSSRTPVTFTQTGCYVATTSLPHSRAAPIKSTLSFQNLEAALPPGIPAGRRSNSRCASSKSPNWRPLVQFGGRMDDPHGGIVRFGCNLSWACRG
jgi:hypothetical protein